MEILHKCITPYKGFTEGTHYLITLDYEAKDDNGIIEDVSKCLDRFEAVTVGTGNYRYVALEDNDKLEKGVIYHCNHNGFCEDPRGGFNIHNGTGYVKFPVETETEKPEQLEQPPLGFIPEYIWEERVNRERLNELLNTVKRYNQVNYPVPTELRDEIVKRALICFKIEEA